MAKSPPRSAPLIEVVCPCCESMLKVDAATGAVITHKEKTKPAPVEDLQAAVSRLRQEESQRDEKFRKAMEEQKSRKDLLNKKFDELFKQVQEDPSSLEPRRKEIDWD